MSRKVIQIGSLFMGGNCPIVIQSMATSKTSNVEKVVQETLECEKYGLQLMRVSIVDDQDIDALNEIKKRIHVPLVADLHFDKRLALKVMDQNIDKIRINPLNIGSIEDYQEIIIKAKENNIVIRLGFNESTVSSPKEMIALAKKYIKIANKLGYDNFVLSFKFSDVQKTIIVNHLAHKTFKHPLHIGVTESGIESMGLLKSASALSPLLLQGIGDTIRISLTTNPVEEIKAIRRLFKSLKIDENWPEIISCPTCGRIEVNLFEVANKITNYLEEKQLRIKVAIMGCPVNGPGEAKSADIGIAGSKNGNWVLFKNGKNIRQIPDKTIIEEFIKEIESL